jgi:hypothetical protein
VNLSRLLQMLQEERGGQSGLRPVSLLRALKQMISQGSRTRRNSGVQALDRPESLEVRQVLSALSPVDDSAPLIAVEESFIVDCSENQGLVAADQADGLLPINDVPSSLLPDGHVVQMVREQLSKSLSQSNLNPGMSIPEGIVQISDKSSTNRGQPGDAVPSDNALINGIEVSTPEMISSGMSDPFFSTASDQLNLSIVIEYSDGPQEVTVENISSTSLQIKVSGLAGTIYEASGAEYTAQVLYQNAMEVLQRVQPTRPVQILFPSSMLGGPDRIPTFPGTSIDDGLRPVPSTGPSPAVLESGAGADAQGPLSNSLGQDSGAKVSSDETSIDSSLIDVFFSVSDLALETSILVKSGISGLQQNLAWPQADSSPTILRQHEEISVRSVELRCEQESVPSGTVASSAQGGLVRLARRGLSWLRPGRLPAASLVSGSVASEFIVGVVAELAARPETTHVSPDSPGEGVEWLSWLLRHSSEANRQIGTGTDNSINPGKLTPGQVPVFSDSFGSSRDVRGAYSPQALIRKYREQHRHAGGLNGAICIALYEHDSSRVPRSTSIPGELRYVANPRGPPVYGRDADVPLLEVDAPADLLERLRYSIAPRGPSLATVETQSPDFTFSSGPSMSPEKVSTELAI